MSFKNNLRGFILFMSIRLTLSMEAVVRPYITLAQLILVVLSNHY